MRNQIAHDDFSLDLRVVWETILKNLPVLIAQIDDTIEHKRAPVPKP